MKKYVKYKNFIPANFIKDIDDNSIKQSNKLIFILIIINIFILPNTISKSINIFKNHEAIQVVNLNIEKDNDEKDSKKELLLFLNSTDESMEIIKLENGIGIIEVDSIEKVYKIEEENNLKIKIVDKEGENYRIEVGL